MTNPNAEAQQRWRERQKQKRLEALKLPDATQGEDLYRQPFFSSRELEANWSNVELCLDLAGIEAPDFSDDSGPKSLNDVYEGAAKDAGDKPYDGAQTSLARAEVVIGCLIDAASEMASIVNAYKRREIAERISEIEESDMSDPLQRKNALDQMVRLTKLRDQLDKSIRWTFRKWKSEED